MLFRVIIAVSYTHLVWLYLSTGILVCNTWNPLFICAFNIIDRQLLHPIWHNCSCLGSSVIFFFYKFSLTLLLLKLSSYKFISIKNCYRSFPSLCFKSESLFCLCTPWFMIHCQVPHLEFVKRISLDPNQKLYNN